MTDPAANDLLILVDSNDNEIGTAAKLDAHQRGLKHRAISALVKNSAGEFLLHRRHAAKYHSGGLWTNACCSHPSPGESTAEAARRRLMQEMGVACALEPLFVFDYRADVPGGTRADGGNTTAANRLLGAIDWLATQKPGIYDGLDVPLHPPLAPEVEATRWI